MPLLKFHIPMESGECALANGAIGFPLGAKADGEASTTPFDCSSTDTKSMEICPFPESSYRPGWTVLPSVQSLRVGLQNGAYRVTLRPRTAEYSTSIAVKWKNADCPLACF